MKTYFLCKQKIVKLYFLFIATIIAIFSVNISYAGIVVELIHVETAQYPTIQAYVTVMDENGDPITDLTESNFSILEDGNAQTPESAILFPPPIDPVAVAQALDHSSSMVDANAIEDMKTAALILIDQLRTDYDDACEIIKFDTIISVEQAFTTDKDLLRDAVERPWTGYRSTRMYDAVYKAIEDTTSYIASQGSLGSVLVVSDGKDNRSSHSLADVISLAASNGIRVFTVGLGLVDAEVLQRMADETGGSYFYAPTPSDLESIFRAIAVGHYGGYIISYETIKTGCRDHILRISVTTNTGSVGEDSKSFLICAQDNGEGGGGLYYVSSGGDGG
jgi:VWFA-related protein